MDLKQQPENAEFVGIAGEGRKDSPSKANSLTAAEAGVEKPRPEDRLRKEYASGFWGQCQKAYDRFWYYQPEVHEFYHDVRVQVFVAGLIFANFVTNIAEKQVWPSASEGVFKGEYYASVFGAFELVYNVQA